MILLGLSFYAVGLTGFIMPSKIVTGGLAGVSLLIEYATLGKIPLQETYFVVNCVLLLIALKVLGGKFLIKTVFGVVVLTALLTYCRTFLAAGFITDEPLLSGVIGGMLCGAGVGLVFSANGSTGGTDIIIAIIGKYKNITFGRTMLFIDFIIISTSYLIFEDVNKIVYGLIVLGVMTYMIDMVVNGSRQSVQYLIISEKYDIMADAINKEMRRGCTILSGMGWYTKKESKVILVLAKRSESIEMFRLIKSIDEKAFISQSTVRGVYGEGFDKIKM